MSLERKLLAKSVASAVAAAVAFTISAGAAAQGGAIEEIVVTAQKREQSLQETPISITAFSTESIEQLGISDVSDITGFVPNLQINESPGGTAGATVAIRGSVTINPAITWEPTVGLYLDGAFLGKNLGGIFDVAELERVEVLRGPQGTLYGKNTVGGAINLITRKPSGEFGGKVRVGVGNENLYNGFISVDTPAFGETGEGLGKLSANAAMFYEERDGFYRNVPDPYGSPLAGPPSSDEFNNLDSIAARLALQLDVTDNFQASYAYDYSDRDQQPSMGVLSDAGDLVNGVAFFLQPYVVDTDKRPDKISNDHSDYEESEVEGHALNLGWDLGEAGFLGDLTLRSITSYRELTYDDAIDIDGSPIDFFHSARHIDYDQTSQELQLLGKTERTDYVVGLYYFEEEADVFNPIDFFSVFATPQSPNSYGFDNESMAAFGQIEWRPPVLDDKLSLTLGARYTEEDKDQYIDHPVVLVDPFIPFAGSADDNWSNTTFTFITGYDLTDDVNLYAKVAEGWKAGGFNGEADSLAGFLTPYDPEEVLSYELGMKSRWADGRLQLNAAAFYNEVTDMQFSIFVGGGAAASIVDNAGEATIQGFEVELIAQPVDSLQLSLNYGYLDPEYDEFIDGGVDVSNNREFPYSPENTASLGLEWDIVQLLGGQLTARVDWSYIDDRVAYPDPAQNTYLQLDSYDVINARLTLADIPMGDNRLKLAAWGKNLTDEEYRINGIPFGYPFWTVSYYGDPRTYGLEATVEF